MPRPSHDHSDSKPQLLVSVRNSVEACEALAGGCQILDVKEPRRGSLGMADPAEMVAILEVAHRTAPGLPVSAALGEAREWSPERAIPVLPAGLDYVKLGTAGLAACEDW